MKRITLSVDCTEKDVDSVRSGITRFLNSIEKAAIHINVEEIRLPSLMAETKPTA